MKPRVFLSYSIADARFAHQIQGALVRANVRVAIEPFGLSPRDSISESISKAVAASDFLILLISPDSLKSDWMTHEVEALASGEWQQRAITVIPVKIRPCVVPKYLAQWHVIDLSRSLDRGLERLVNVVRIAPHIDLSKLRGEEFVRLVYELLRAYGFRRIKHAYGAPDRGFDFMAELHAKDPFGRETTEQWTIQVKSSRNKTDISALKEFFGFSSWRPEKPNALFVTATQLTSAAKEWISSMPKHNVPRLIILEGTDITRLLLGKPKVAERFFPAD
jgi:hypothetical protein